MDTLTWTVNQYQRQIKRGDQVYFWVSGKEAGIIASGTILCDPEVRDPNPDDPYNRGAWSKNEPYLAVDIRIDRRLTDRVLRTVLLADARTERLEVLTYPAATNSRVTHGQQAVIEGIIRGTYEPIPVVDAPAVEVANRKRYWLYAPGEQAGMWGEFLKPASWAFHGMNLGICSNIQPKKKSKQP